MFRNWPEIRRCMDRHPMLMREIIRMDTAKPDSIDAILMAALPQFFSPTPVAGPVPWSELLAHGRSRAAAERLENLDERQKFLDTRGTLEHFGLPVVAFALADHVEQTMRYPPVPDSIPEDAEFGDVVHLDGVSYVIVEDGIGLSDILYLCPLACIDLQA